MKNQSHPKTRICICMDSRLKTALLQTAALNQERPGKIITRALADYLAQRRAESQQPEAQSAQKAERFPSQNQTHTPHER
jgi:hypothetical protein